jgi:hypothetical protein
MYALPIRLGISARERKNPAPDADLSRFFGRALQARKNDNPPVVSPHVFYGQSRPHGYSSDKTSPDYDEAFADYVEKAKEGFDRADEGDLVDHILDMKLSGYDPFPETRPRQVGTILDLSSVETRDLGEHPLKSRFNAARKELIAETQGLVTALMATGQMPGGNYSIPFCQAAATYYAQNNIVTDADPFRDETDDPGEGKSNTYAMNNIASLDEGLQLILQEAANDPRPLTDIVITTHGADGELKFVDAGGNVQTVAIGKLDDFLSCLKDMAVIKPGTQLHLMGCSVAQSKESQTVLQGLSTKYGLRIIANRTASTMRRPSLSNAMVFYPGTDIEHDLVQKYYDYKNAAANSP